MCKRKRGGGEVDCKIVELEEEEGRKVDVELEEEGEGHQEPPLPHILIQRFCQRYNERVKRKRRRSIERGDDGRGA